MLRVTLDIMNQGLQVEMRSKGIAKDTLHGQNPSLFGFGD
jgi:hypothetical protein